MTTTTPDRDRTLLKWVEDTTGVTVTATGPITHQCPHEDEVDAGHVTIKWALWDGRTIELHSLAAYLRSWEPVEISHEELVDVIASDLRSIEVFVLDVTATFTTAGLLITAQWSRDGDL